MRKEYSNSQKHSAGVIVSHEGRFSSLKTYSNKEEITQAFREKWVIPYYMNLSRLDDEWVKEMKAIYKDISDAIILQNLGDFNWRTRGVGAYFSILKDKREFIDIIGSHLLKSEVCCVGDQYAFALNYFNTKKSRTYLIDYLDYYLAHPELFFDQYDVISALKHLDEKNATHHLNDFLPRWKAFLEERRAITEKRQQGLIEQGLIPKSAGTEDSPDPLNYSISTKRISEQEEIIRRIKT